MTFANSLRGMLKLSVRCSCRRRSSPSLNRLLSSGTAGSPSLLRSPRFIACACSCTSELRLRLRGRDDWEVRRPCVRASLIAAACSNLHVQSMDATQGEHAIKQDNEIVCTECQETKVTKIRHIFQLAPHPSKFSLVPPVVWRQYA